MWQATARNTGQEFRQGCMARSYDKLCFDPSPHKFRSILATALWKEISFHKKYLQVIEVKILGRNLLSIETWIALLNDVQDLPSPWIVSCVLVICTILGFWAAPKFLRWRHLADLRKKKRESCARAIKHLELMLEQNGQLSNEEVDEITSLALVQLVDRLQSGSLSAVQALEAYQRKALEVHKKTNCLVEPIAEAEEWAKQADMLQGPKPPLHGVPLSVKDIFGIEGYDSTVGLARFIDQPMNDCVVIQVMKSQGAIPFVKTNVPQTMLSWENTNPIFGMTRNPRDLTRGPGGSSGGEGALVAGGGSVLGIGSDIGGSIRLPAACCGVYGFKLTGGRTSLRGMQFASEGQLLVPVANGPLARDVDSLVVCTKALMSPSMFEIDVYTPPLPFKEKAFSEKKGKALKIGFYVDDGLFTAVPPVSRAVREAAECLKNQGHQVVEWDFAHHGSKILHLWPRVIFGDKGETLRRALADDKTDDAVGSLLTILNVPGFVRKFIAFVARPWWPRMSTVMSQMGGMSGVYEWWSHVELVKDLREEVVRDWQKNGFDAVLAPGMGCVPLPLGWAKYSMGSLTFTTAFNLLNFPTGSMPVTTVQKKDFAEPYAIRDPWFWVAKKTMEGAEGLPVNVQVASLPWQDEKCLYAMKVLESALKK